MSVSPASVRENPYPDEPMFSKLWQMFYELGPDWEWQAYGNQEKNHKVFVLWRNGQPKAIGFAHELAKLSTDQLRRLLAIYWEKEIKTVSQTEQSSV